MSVTIGMLGAGAVAQLHAQAIAQTPGAELVSIFDPDRARAEALAQRTGARVEGAENDVLADPTVRAVYVLTPAATHVAVAERCIDAGKHVLIEKPVAADPRDVLHLQELAASAGVTAMPGHNYLYLPECSRLVRQARAGGLGDLRFVSITYALRHDEELAGHYGSPLEEVLVHHAYIALAACGTPDRVAGGASRGIGWQLPTDDQAWMAWEYDRGTTALMFASFAVDDLSADPATFTVKVLGTEGSGTFSWRSLTGSGGPFRVGLPLYEETYVHEAAAFRDAVEHGIPPLSSMSDAAEVARILAEVGRS